MARNTVNIDKVDVGIDLTSPSNQVTWATGRNVMFTPGYVSASPGKSWLATLPVGSLTIREIFTFMGYDGNTYSIVCTDAQIFASRNDLLSFTDITPSPAPSGGVNDFWDFTIVAGLPLLTNGKDAVWKWSSYSSVLTASSTIPVAKNISCCMHKLVCSNIVDNGIAYPGRVKWSVTGQPENFTIDTSRNAGRFDLCNYQDGKDIQHNILSQVVNGSKLYFFTEKNVWLSDFAEPVKQFVTIDNDFELISKRTAFPFDGGTVAAEKRDIYQFTGSQKQSIGKPVKTDFKSGINAQALNYAFGFQEYKDNELYFCFSTGSNTGLPDTAYVYNWELSTANNPVWAIQDCDFTCHSTYYLPPYVAWVNNSTATVTWTNNSSATTKWIQMMYNSVAQDIVGDTASHILLMDSGNNALDTSLNPKVIYNYIESGDFSLKNRPLETILEELYPDLALQTSNAFYIQVGTRDNLSQAINWSPAVTMTIGSDYYADLKMYTNQGAFIRFRFYTNLLNQTWSMSNYSFNYKEGRKIR
jgi:hypothetical protein